MRVSGRFAEKNTYVYSIVSEAFFAKPAWILAAHLYELDSVRPFQRGQYAQARKPPK